MTLTAWDESLSTDGSYLYGTRNDYPVVGDYANGGPDTAGVVRRTDTSTGEPHWFVSIYGSGTLSFYYGTYYDYPLVGDWDCNGSDTPGVVRYPAHLLLSNGLPGAPAYDFSYGNADDYFVSGAWNSSLCSRPIIRRQASATWYPETSLGSGSGPTFAWGLADEFGMTADWDTDTFDDYALGR
jgi:hypothetical protein